jgi:hypothetical protein
MLWHFVLDRISRGEPRTLRLEMLQCPDSEVRRQCGALRIGTLAFDFSGLLVRSVRC